MATSGEGVAGYVQEIIEAAIQAGMLSGYDPRFVLQGISEAMVDEKELDNLAKTWGSPPVPTAVIAIPSFESGSKQPPGPGPDSGTTGSSVPALGSKLSRILESTQDNPVRQSCVVRPISEIVNRLAFRGGLAIKGRVGSLTLRMAPDALGGIAIRGGHW